MKLHHDKEMFRDAIISTTNFLNLRDIFVEKDYWITVALHTIFTSEVGNHSVFKGGTALSKCYGLIERFSEDIDLVILRNPGESDNQLKNRIRSISKTVEKVMPEIEVKGMTNKKGNIRKTLHQYEKTFDGDFGQVREHIVVEASSLGNFEPFETKSIQSYIYDMIQAKGGDDIIQKYNLAPFPIQVLSKLRTFCEKIMSLVRFSSSENPILDLRNKIRHVYDIHQMMHDKEIMAFLNSSEFDAMIIQVGKDDFKSYKSNNEWLHEHPSRALLFHKTQQTWEQLSPEYHGNFKDLVTGTLPDENSILQKLDFLSSRLKKVRWKIIED